MPEAGCGHGKEGFVVGNLVITLGGERNNKWRSGDLLMLIG